MLNLNEVKIGALIKISGEPYIVTKSDHQKMAQRRPVVKARLRNLLTGAMLEQSFVENEKIEEAETEIRTANHLYRTGTEASFMDNESFEQFDLPLKQIGDKAKFLKDGTDVDVLYFQGRPVAVKLPIKVALKVVAAPPGVKGNSAGNVTKTVELETGAQLSVPMFINEGDMILVNTDTEEYVSRA